MELANIYDISFTFSGLKLVISIDFTLVPEKRFFIEVIWEVSTPCIEKPINSSQFSKALSIDLIFKFLLEVIVKFFNVFTPLNIESIFMSSYITNFKFLFLSPKLYSLAYLTNLSPSYIEKLVDLSKSADKIVVALFFNG